MVLPRSIDTHLLECLVTLISECSVTRAAERMGMSQPQMSNALSRLRVIFGDPLLVRSSQRLVPTTRALEIFGPLKAGLAQIGEAFVTPENFNPQTSERRFIIAMSDYISLLMLPKLMVEIRRKAPRFSVAIKLMVPENITQWLDNGDCDIAFGWFTHPNERLRASVVMHDQAICIARAGHPQIDGQITLEQFAAADHGLVAGAPSPVSTLEHLVETTLAELGIVRRVVLNSANSSSIASVVAVTDMIAVLSYRMAVELERQLPLQLLPVPFRLNPFDITMVWHERHHREPAHEWLRKTIRAVFR